ncbi:MAG: hypothetical protein ACTS4W_01975 [Candidatus Hodgkinia cicadicola]
MLTNVKWNFLSLVLPLPRVVLTDWNVITNDVNLSTNEREEVNTILMERRREV